MNRRVSVASGTLSTTEEDGTPASDAQYNTTVVARTTGNAPTNGEQQQQPAPAHISPVRKNVLFDLFQTKTGGDSDHS